MRLEQLFASECVRYANSDLIDLRQLARRVAARRYRSRDRADGHHAHSVLGRYLCSHGRAWSVCLVNRSRGIITLALGNAVYLDMARDLAHSLRLHCGQIPRALVTDSRCPVLASLYDIVIPAKAEHGMGFIQKLHLNSYSPFDTTLFIDADSLVTRNLEFIWEMCRDTQLGYAGEVRTDGDWHGACIAAVCSRIGRNWLATLNSGMLCFESGEITDSIFERARRVLQNDYETLGFASFRNDKADEAGLAVALSEHQIRPLDDQGRTMRTPIGIEGPMQINILRGLCKFVKRGQLVSPAIVHFATWQSHPLYFRERARLRLHFASKAVRWLSGLGASYVYHRERCLSARRSLVARWNTN